MSLLLSSVVVEDFPGGKLTSFLRRAGKLWHLFSSLSPPFIEQKLLLVWWWCFVRRPSVPFWKSGKCLEKSTLVNISRMRKNERKIRSMKSGLRERWRRRRRRRGQSSIINNYWAERERSGNERHNECNNNSLGMDRNRNVTKVADFVVKCFTLIWDDIR